MATPSDPWTSLDPARIVGELFDEKPVTPRIARLFSCACCRLVWDRLTLPELRSAIAVSERLADGSATEEERDAAQADLLETFDRREEEAFNPDIIHGHWLARFVCEPDPPTDGERRRMLCEVLGSVEEIANTNYFHGLPGFGGWKQPDFARKAIRAAQISLIRCLIPENRRLPPLPADWLSTTVISLATAIYDDHAFDRMPILADALEDAGCDDRAMLTHCRNAHRHARGCWVLDRILGKNS